MSATPSEIIRTLFSGVGMATQSQRQRLDRLKRNCMDYQDPHACYLVLEMGVQPIISWSHNTKAHFGQEHEKLSYQGYLSLLHPSWTIPYYMYGNRAYTIAASMPVQLQKEGITFTSTIPLLGRDGHYYWYDQIAIPGALNERMELVSHLNYYRRLGRYDKLIPGPPSLYSRGEPDAELEPLFKAEGQEIIEPFLSAFFSPGQVEFFQGYRRIPEVMAGQQPARPAGAAALGLSISAYDRTQQRIKEVLDFHFEGFMANTAHSFACFLNNYFSEK